jgi:hypothetical protein
MSMAVYIPEDNSEHHTRRRENLKSQTVIMFTALHLEDQQQRALTRKYRVINGDIICGHVIPRSPHFPFQITYKTLKSNQRHIQGIS